jgi:hypothetical protein
MALFFTCQRPTAKSQSIFFFCPLTWQSLFSALLFNFSLFTFNFSLKMGTTLTKWLNEGGSYKDGLELYQRLKKNNEKDTFFLSQADAGAESLHYIQLRNFLANALRKRNGFDLALPTTQTPAVETKGTGKGKSKQKVKEVSIRSAEHPVIDENRLDEEGLKLFMRTKHITRILSGLRLELEKATTDAQRQKVAIQMDELTKERLAIWAVLKAPKGDAPTASTGSATGNNSATGEPDAATVLEAHKRIKSLRDQIGKYKKELKDPNLAKTKADFRKRKIVEFEKEIGEKQAIIKQVEK